MESIRHSSLVAEPSGAPSSKNPRRYQSPSQASRSSAAFKASRVRRHVRRGGFAARLGATAQRPTSVACRNQPSQTLSPSPFSPTRFMPSFQSPVADERQSVPPDRQTAIERERAVFEQRGAFLGNRRLKEVVASRQRSSAGPRETAINSSSTGVSPVASTYCATA